MDVGTIAIAALIIEVISVGISSWCSRWFYRYRLDRQHNKVQQSVYQPQGLVLSRRERDRAYRISTFVFFLLSWLSSTILFALAITITFPSFVSFLTRYESDAYMWLYVLCMFALFLGIVLICNIIGFYVGIGRANKRVMRELEDVSRSSW